nr:immunoglobulin heavy chain junction region [Macaca mulatta]
CTRRGIGAGWSLDVW